MTRDVSNSMRVSKNLQIATYNVRSLTVDKQHQLVTGCALNSIDIIAIQEHRQRFPTELDYQVIPTGTIIRSTANPKGVGGIGLYVNSRLYKYILACTKISERILLASFEGNPVISVVVCYAPTEASEKEDKDDFYSKLNCLIQDIPSHNMLVLLGDFNARLGIDNYNPESRTIGQFLYHSQTNNNGSRLLELCQTANLCDLQSRKPHRKGRQWTWMHPNRISTAQLDHIIIRTKWANSFSNCRAYNSVNVESDHRILTAKMKVSLRATTKNAKRLATINWTRLKDPVAHESFKLELKNRFSSLSDQSDVQAEYNE